MLAAASRSLARSTFDEALEQVKRGGARPEEPTLISATFEVELGDPIATVFASRLARDEWFCWSESDREFELATLGSATTRTATGPDRFVEVAAACAEVMQRSVSIARDGDGDELGGRLAAGAGPVWVGGFSFADSGARSSHWSSFEPAAMTMPEIALHRQAGRTLMTFNFLWQGSDPTAAARQRLEQRLSGLREEPLGMLDPHPAQRPSIASRHSPEHFERAVGSAISRMESRRSTIRKVVLAREVLVTGSSAHDPGALFGALRDGFPSCFCFCRGTPEGSFLGASPELLVRRSGASAVTVALAGSSRRSSDPAIDDHLGERLLRSEKDRREHRIVAERIARNLRPHSVWVEAAPEPGLARVANIQHLATPIAAQLRQSYSAIELAGLLHPTPAVGGEPWPDAAAMVEDLEEIDRGWYAAPVGWMDAAEDGEFCVALRSALVRDRQAHLFAGVGIVPGSDPSAELAETETKLEALLPLLAD